MNHGTKAVGALVVLAFSTGACIVITDTDLSRIMDEPGQGEPGHWVGTWGESPQLTETSNNPPSPGLADNTLRQFIYVSIGGTELRVQVSNEFGASAHAAEVLAYGIPILPFGGSDYDSTDHEAARQTVNDWIRTSGTFDAVIDLEAVVADPESPTELLPSYDDGDKLHLSPAGYQAMADAIDLDLFVSDG
jgi:hypothetical protein